MLGDPLETQGGVVGEEGSEGPNISEGLRRGIKLLGGICRSSNGWYTNRDLA